MHLIRLIFSFLVGRFNKGRRRSFKEMIKARVDEVVYRSRKPVALLLVGIISIFLFTGGFFMALGDLTGQYDSEGTIRASATAITGGVLALVILAAYVWVFTSAWPGVKTKAKIAKAEKKALETGTHPPPTSLEQAFSLLVMDVVKEREEKRRHRYEMEQMQMRADQAAAATTAASATAMNESTTTVYPTH